MCLLICSLMVPMSDGHCLLIGLINDFYYMLMQPGVEVSALPCSLSLEYPLVDQRPWK